MEEIYLKALVARVQNEPDLLDKLPEEIRNQVEERLEAEQPQELQL